jgi:hypothetical protein
MAIATSTALLASSALAAGAGVYTANQANRSANRAANNQLDPVQLAGQSQALQQQYGPGNVALTNSLTGQRLLGSPSFDLQGWLQSQDPATREAWAQEAASQGRDLNEWLGGHLRELQREGSPLYDEAAAEFGRQDPNSMLGLLQQMAPTFDRLQNRSNTSARASDLGDLQSMGGAWADAIRGANPDLLRATGNLEAAVAAGRGQGFTPTERSAAAFERAQGSDAAFERARASSLFPGLEADAAGALGSRTQIQAELERQALAELATGGRLSAEATRDAEQATRAAFADRGMAMSNPAIFQEALNKEQLTRQRAAEARALGLQVDQAGLAQTGMNRDYALGVSDRGTALNQFNAQGANQMAMFNTDAANRLAQFNAQGANQVGMFNTEAANRLAMFDQELARMLDNDQFSRELALTGVRQSQAIDPTQLLQARGVGTGAATGLLGQAQVSSLFDPQLASLYNANFNAQQAGQLAAGNNQAAIAGSLIGGAGNIFGAYLATRPAA